MDTTPEDPKEEHPYERNQRIRRELNKKEIIYRKEIIKGTFNVTIDWQDEISLVDQEYLLSTLTIKGLDDFEQQFTIEYLDLDRILNYRFGGKKQTDRVFPDNKLFDTQRNDSKVTKLINYIKDGNTICPPFIDFEFVPPSYEEQFSIYDGNHRIGLSRFLKLKKIPFIVRKTNIDRIKNL